MEIEFIENSHIYLIDGVIVPSVTKIISTLILPKKYDGVPKNVLNEAGKFGSAIHEAVELYENGKVFTLTPMQEKVFDEYIKLKNEHKFKPVSQEKITHYKDLYIGTYDMIAEYNGKRILCDIKTNAEIDKEYLAWQLGMYKMALNYQKKKIDECYCIWLPKHGSGAFVKIDYKKSKEIKKLLNSEGFEKLCEC